MERERTWTRAPVRVPLIFAHLRVRWTRAPMVAAASATGSFFASKRGELGLGPP